MKVSIITISYNSGLFIEDCIKSVLSQTYPNLEYIIVDGASTDSTLQIVRSFENGVHTVISEPDSGIYDAINKGLKLATGDIVGVLNSDDVFTDANVVERIVKEFVDIDIVFSDVQFVKQNDLNEVVRHYSSKFFKPWMFKYGFQPAHPTFYAKRELFEKFGNYRTDLKIAGDFELLLRFLKKSKVPYKYVKDIWVKMRVGGVSTSGLSSVIKLNNEIVKAHEVNSLSTNRMFVYSKYLIKWWGFIKKK